MRERVIAHVARALQLYSREQRSTKGKRSMRHSFGADDDDFVNHCPLCTESTENQDRLKCHEGKNNHPEYFHRSCLHDMLEHRPAGSKNLCPLCREPCFIGTMYADLPRHLRDLLPEPREVNYDIFFVLFTEGRHIFVSKIMTGDWSNKVVGTLGKKNKLKFESCKFNSVMNTATISNVSFVGCVLGRDPKLGELSMRGTHFHKVDAERCKIVSVNLSKSKWSNCGFNLNCLIDQACLDDSILEHGYMYNMVIRDSDMVNCTFDKIRLNNTDFESVSMNNSKFINMSIEHCDFSTNVFLNESKFGNCTLLNCDFSKVHLSQSVFTKTTFTSCSFDKSILSGARFQNCTMTDCHFEDTNFTDVEFIATELHMTSESLTNAQLKVGTFAGTYLNNESISNTESTSHPKKKPKKGSTSHPKKKQTKSTRGQRK